MNKIEFIQEAKQLMLGYQPSAETIKKVEHIDLVAIVGPTGVGKSTIIKKLGIPEVVSDVSRERRKGEKNHIDYRFRTDYLEILQDIKYGEYVQYLISGTDEFYGTKWSAYPSDGYCTMAIYADKIDEFKNIRFRQVKQFFIIPQSYVEWMRRIGVHRSEDLHRRLEEAKTSIQLALNDNSYVFILNDNIATAVQEIKDSLAGKKIDQHRSQLAKATAGSLRSKIGDNDNYFDE